MKKTGGNVLIIVYKSNSGYSKAYAELLADALDLNVYSIDELPEVHRGSDAIFFGWIFADAVVGYKKADKELNLIATIGVGMGPDTPEIVSKITGKCKIPASTKVFYLQGGFDINKLKGPNKLIMQIKVKEIIGRLEKAGTLTPAQEATYKMCTEGYSCVCLENLQPVIDWYKAR